MPSEGSKSVRLKITDLLISRDGAIPTKDSRLTNCFIEDINGSPQVLKRPGYALSTSAATGVGRGFTVVKDPVTGNQKSYTVVNNTLYSVGTAYPPGGSTVLMHFDATAGTQTTTEVYGHSQAWTGAVGSISVSSTRGKFGGASLTSGAGDTYITVSGIDTGTNPIAANAVWTLECFVWSSAVDAFLHNIFGVANAAFGIMGLAAYVSAGVSYARVSVSNNGSSWNVANGVDNQVGASGNKFSDSTWHHVACCFTGSAFKFYWDGTQFYSVVSATCQAMTKIYIGSDANLNLKSIAGNIDEVRLIGIDSTGVVPVLAYSR